MSEESIADSKFPKEFSKRERAIFEVGIKLGALYHIAMGFPISKDPETISSIETALARSIENQPYVTDVEVIINQENVKGTKLHEFDYSQIDSSILEAIIRLKYKDVQVTGVIEWNAELNYPLMYIKKIQ
jgi:dihydroneopterin aldolase